MIHMRIPKDLWHLLIHKYFDLPTIYKCQFVSKKTNEEIIKDSKRLKMARNKYYVSNFRKKQNKYVKTRLLLNARERVPPTIKKKEHKKHLQEVLKNLYVCKGCGEIHSTTDILTNNICKWNVGRNVCMVCQADAPNLSYSLHDNNKCPLEMVTCGVLKSQLMSYNIFRFWAQDTRIRGKVVSECSFKGCIAESKQHYLECQRKCLCCRDTFLLTNIQKHLKKCFPHLIMSGILDTHYVS